MKNLFVAFVILLGVGLSTQHDSVFGKIGTVQYPCPQVGYRRLPHTNSCDKYVQCLGDHAFVVKCASGLHFNSLEEKCMSSDLANCSIDRMPCPLYNDHKNPVYLSSNRDCNRYFLCYNNLPVSFNCADGFNFDPFHWQCRSAEQTNCDNVDVTCPDSGIEAFPHPEFCDRYIACWHGYDYGVNCPDGQHFDIHKKSCLPAHQATCYSQTTTEPPTETETPTIPIETDPPSTEPGTTTPEETTVPSEETTTAEETTTTPEETTVPSEETTTPEETTTTPEETTVPSEETTTPEETTTTPEETTVPSEETTTPEETTTTPEETTVPSEETTTPEDTTTTPEETTAPSEETTVPVETDPPTTEPEITTPEETTVPSEETTTPEETTTTPEETTIPSEETTVPSEETTVPSEETTTPEETEAPTTETEKTTTPEEPTTPEWNIDQFECPSGVILWRFEHPLTCTKYILCFWGNASEQNCPRNTIFYKYLRICRNGNTETCTLT